MRPSPTIANCIVESPLSAHAPRTSLAQCEARALWLHPMAALGRIRMLPPMRRTIRTIAWLALSLE